MPVRVTYSQSFLKLMQSLPNPELKLVGDFITHLQTAGYASLPGRNKPSTGVSQNHVNRIRLIQFAIREKLWHYHVGYKRYNQSNPFGDWTSSHVVHYQNPGETARLVHYDSHPPMRLPHKNTLP